MLGTIENFCRAAHAQMILMFASANLVTSRLESKVTELIFMNGNILFGSPIITETYHVTNQRWRMRMNH